MQQTVDDLSAKIEALTEKLQINYSCSNIGEAEEYLAKIEGSSSNICNNSNNENPTEEQGEEAGLQVAAGDCLSGDLDVQPAEEEQELEESQSLPRIEDN